MKPSLRTWYAVNTGLALLLAVEAILWSMHSRPPPAAVVAPRAVVRTVAQPSAAQPAPTITLNEPIPERAPSDPKQLIETARLANSLLQDSRAAAMAREQKKSALQRQLTFALAKMADLGPERIQQLKALLLERAVGREDATIGAAAQGIAPDSTTAAQAITNATTDVEQRIQALLGERYAEYKEYERISGTVDAFQLLVAPMLEFVGTPLTPVQEEELARIGRDSGMKTSLYPNLTRTIDTDTALQRAQAVLTPEQYAYAEAQLKRYFYHHGR